MPLEPGTAGRLSQSSRNAFRSALNAHGMRWRTA